MLPGQEHSQSEPEVNDTQNSGESGRVTLPAEKLAAAKLKIEAIRPQEFQSHKAVPGSIVYDATRKVEVRATVECIVKQTLVQSAENVVKGQPLLILTGPEIGSAHSEISQVEGSLALLEKELAWTMDTHTNMNELLAFLAQSPTSEQVKAEFENKKIGEHRNEILSAYAELALAKNVIQRTNKLESEGVIAGKDVDERKRALDVASAKYNSIREEMTFQSSQQLAAIQTRVEAEQKRLAIAWEKLRALLGPNANFDDIESNDQGVSDFVVNAPRGGQIVALPAVVSARFAQGEVMAEIADSSNVWVEAQISQRDWHSLNLEPEQQLAVRVPALPDQNFVAVVKYIGTSVSKSTMAIPLIADLDNTENRFRPGMSIWVDIPTSKRRTAIVVPEGAVQRNELQTFVFVQTGAATFEAREVLVGQQSGEQLQIESGLSEGERVVVDGAFFLKSELLLAEEE